MVVLCSPHLTGTLVGDFVFCFSVICFWGFFGQYEICIKWQKQNLWRWKNANVILETRLKVWMCKENFVYQGLGPGMMFHSVCSRSRCVFFIYIYIYHFVVVVCCCCYSVKSYSEKKTPIDLLTLHWVSAGPHSADARRATLSTEARWWQFTCTCLLKDLMHLFVFFVRMYCVSFYL